MKRRETVKHEGERHSILIRYLGEVATAVSGVNGMSRQELFDALVASAKRKTATADGVPNVHIGKHGLRPVREWKIAENVPANLANSSPIRDDPRCLFQLLRDALFNCHPHFSLRACQTFIS